MDDAELKAVKNAVYGTYFTLLWMSSTWMLSLERTLRLRYGLFFCISMLIAFVVLVSLLIRNASKTILLDDLVDDGRLRENRKSVLGMNSEMNSNLELERRIVSLEEELSRLKAQIGKKTETEATVRKYPAVKFRNEGNRKRILVTGGAGFVGSHLVDRLMLEGHEVIALDNYFTGRKRNIQHWIGHPNFELVHHDVVNTFFTEVDQIYHLASPASPPHYMYNPVKTIKTNTIGTINMLGLARRVKARVLLASTSEIYGDPEIHPQPETYWGHVNTIGPRSCYDEGKRVAESLMVAYHKQEQVDIRIARIFNTFGPRMHMNDGRVVSNFILQALQGQPITIYGDGNQTRSFQYVDDLVEGLIALMNSNTTLPVNLGNPEEHTIQEFAYIIRDLIGSKSPVVHKDGQQDDPKQRKPDITRAANLFGWKPQVSMRDGLRETIDFFRHELEYEKTKMEEEKFKFALKDGDSIKEALKRLNTVHPSYEPLPAD
ncbi:UDP-glucuronic acid decarboxylase 1 [Toxocara canis]|uniref:UDP-glucuronate decarboxylase n=1 Tax=Toxocara canis TaxID=6265 RepID=A0A0B2VMK4_TOXCA|nr:UDP-glucuronic acid decarboxylase 1 [Toxocara canis]